MKMTWCISNNVGDALNVYLAKKITGETPVFVQTSHDTHRKFMACGSILNHADKDTVVWGAGIANADDVIDPRCDIRAVRGPLTADRCKLQAGIDCKVYGDPALLMPMFYNPERMEHHKVGVIPHYINQSEVFDTLPDGWKFINVFDDIETIVRQIKGCKKILSSSLHGLILAHAYGVPALWFEGMYPLGGDGTKFYDYFASVTSEGYDPLGWPLKWHDIVAGGCVRGWVPDSDKITEVCDKLWEACPFK
jgi:hypothetical protein